MSSRETSESALSIHNSGWCDAEYLLQNRIGTRLETVAMLEQADQLGYDVTISYALHHDPRGGDYPEIIAEPSLIPFNGGKPLAIGWASIFEFVKNQSMTK